MVLNYKYNNLQGKLATAIILIVELLLADNLGTALLEAALAPVASPPGNAGE